MSYEDALLERITEQEAKNACANAKSKFEAGRLLGLPNNGTGGRVFKKLVLRYSLDLSHIEQKKSLRKYKTVTKNCPVCTSEFTTQVGSKSEKTTCCCACSNTFFRSGDDNGRRTQKQKRIANGEQALTYSELCWKHHEKQCVICDEKLIVAVHHYNGNHSDNRPENLVPLCPTHHQYWHSRHRSLVQSKVDEYVKKFLKNHRDIA
jgi:hypothetical protein